MHLDDRLTIETPEGLSIEVTLAGLGSRFGAAVLDLLIQGVLLLALTLAMSLAGSVVSADLGVFLLGLGTLLIAIIVLGYYIVFEALNGGRTPGKAAFGIHVATVDGTALGLGAVTLRTLMRLIDFLPAAYAIGAVMIAISPRNQRLGDVVANTVVVRRRTAAVDATSSEVPAETRGWDVSVVTDAEIALIRRFVQRRSSLAPDARSRLARDLAARLRPKIARVDEPDDELFLVQVLAEKAGR